MKITKITSDINKVNKSYIIVLEKESKPNAIPSFQIKLIFKYLEENISEGVILLSFYSLGLAIPFIISGVLIDKFLSFSKNFRKYMSSITKIGGFILLLTGIAILTNQLQILGFFILEHFPVFENIG